MSFQKQSPLIIQNTKIIFLLKKNLEMMETSGNRCTNDHFFEKDNFDTYTQLHNDLKKIPHVEDVLSVVNAVYLLKDTVSQKLIANPVFPARS